MATAPAVLGRSRAIGLGKETTSGTAVAASVWLPQQDHTIEDALDRIWDNSGLGTRNANFQGDTRQEMATGNINGFIYPSLFGHILLAALGTVNTANHGSATGVKVHTFTAAETLPTYTLSSKDINESTRAAFGVLNTLQIAFNVDGYVGYESGWMARRGTSVANTPSYTTEKPFRPQDVVIKAATTVAGLSGATALRMREGSLNLNNNIETELTLGTVAPDFYPKTFETSMALTRRYLDTTIKDLVFGTTQNAISIKMTRSDVSIGTGTPTNPSLEFIFEPGFFSEWSRSGGLDDLKDETSSFAPLFSTATSKQFSAVLTNLTTAY